MPDSFVLLLFKEKNTKYIAAILPSVPFQENWRRVSWCWPKTVNYCDKRLLNPAMKVYFSHTRNLITADSFSLSGSETKVLLSGRSSISEGLRVLCWVSCEWANNLCHSHITEYSEDNKWATTLCNNINGLSNITMAGNPDVKIAHEWFHNRTKQYWKSRYCLWAFMWSF